VGGGGFSDGCEGVGLIGWWGVGRYSGFFSGVGVVVCYAIRAVAGHCEGQLART